MAFGFIHSMEVDQNGVLWVLVSLVITNIVIILVEAMINPDY